MYYLNKRAINIIIVFLLLTSCAKQKSTPFRVIYEVKQYSSLPEKTWIAYTDSTGECVTFYTTEKQWSKEVILPPDQIAWLFVMTLSDSDCKCKRKPCYDWFNKTRKCPLASGKIIHSRKTVEKYHPNLISISLHQLETEQDNPEL